MKLLIHIALALLPLKVFSQDIVNELLLINKAYQNANLSMDIHTEISGNDLPADQNYSSNKKLILKGDYRFSVQETIEYLRDSDYVVIIDHAEKKITMAKSIKSDSNSVDFVDLSALQGAIEYTRNITFKKEGSLMRYIILLGDYDLYKEIELLVNKQHLINELKLTSADNKIKVKITCEYRLPKNFKAKNLTDYFHLIKGHYTPQEFLADYKFYNFYSKK